MLSPMGWRWAFLVAESTLRNPWNVRWAKANCVCCLRGLASGIEGLPAIRQNHCAKGTAGSTVVYRYTDDRLSKYFDEGRAANAEFYTKVRPALLNCVPSSHLLPCAGCFH